MDTVGALNKYRKNITDDPEAWEMLCYLYKDGPKKEADIAAITGITPAQIRRVFRELYQANIIYLIRENQFELTRFGEDVVSGLGVDRVIAPFLIDDVVQAQEKRYIHRFADWAFDMEPSKVSLAIKSLKNLRVFLSHNRDAPGVDPLGLALTCISSADSNLRTILSGPEAVGERLIVHFASHGKPAETESVYYPTFLKEYKKAITLSNAASILFMDACERSLSPAELSPDVTNHLSFRFYNYLHSPVRDYVIESCAPRLRKENEALLERTIGKSLSFDLDVAVGQVSTSKPHRFHVHGAGGAGKTILATVFLAAAQKSGAFTPFGTMLNTGHVFRHDAIASLWRDSTEVSEESDWKLNLLKQLAASNTPEEEKTQIDKIRTLLGTGSPDFGREEDDPAEDDE